MNRVGGAWARLWTIPEICSGWVWYRRLTLHGAAVIFIINDYSQVCRAARLGTADDRLWCGRVRQRWPTHFPPRTPAITTVPTDHQNYRNAHISWRETYRQGLQFERLCRHWSPTSSARVTKGSRRPLCSGCERPPVVCLCHALPVEPVCNCRIHLMVLLASVGWEMFIIVYGCAVCCYRVSLVCMRMSLHPFMP
jgi:hypothetical protein